MQTPVGMTYADFYEAGEDPTSSFSARALVTFAPDAFTGGSGLHQQIAYIGDNGNTAGETFWFRILDEGAADTGRLAPVFFHGDSGPSDRQFTGNSLQPGGTYDLWVTYDPTLPSNQQIGLTINGQTARFDAAGSTLAAPDDPVRVGIGLNETQRFTGQIHEFKIGLAPEAMPLITDHFNDYGTTTAPLAGTQSQTASENDGWAGQWTGVASSHYRAGERLSYNDANYNNGPNEGGAEDGVAGIRPEGGIQAGQVATRAFARPITGTVWVSALAQFEDSAGGDVLLWFDVNDPEAGAQDFIGFRAGSGSLRYEGDNSSAGTFEAGETHLLLAKIDINADGSNDTVDFWIDPDLSGGEAGLGTALLSGSGADAFGDALNNVGVSFSREGSRLDALRIGSGADGFTAVTMIPEPGAMALLGLGGLALTRRRRGQ